ncbi:unnamed protein product [Arabidopsis lyrata]|uniref:F-box domain-containing protein n=1 Tax=Arabidopsis lyrata subsp. lyrata TaxID=81972 RepID=D7MUW7_ARALL|nr:putative F-box/LRR-repeat protein At5g54820 [Arabidopsis lyrata subsp. lyrata]EFH40616.1 hypothetical protein ARALYDRAFT_331822 [Arabidopsis lyrata subsp. lyrata]CAH8279695.1 unnamed protein product [Arabidopsis lyrata]|eukprot:XP_002864357.1 putative F-box/LRR-repeat protein At5g54820 [Arabidopsis lyrata subsp. lyrata]
MDSIQQDRLSSLPDVLLIVIISFLPFKECVRTSALSRRWRYLCQETRNLSFRESDFVSPYITGEYSRFAACASFFSFADNWLSRIQDQVVESFEICFSNPVGFEHKIEALIEYAVSKRVKNLVIDLSNPAWRNYNDISSVCVSYLHFIVTLPKSVYSLTTLESLKIYGCKFDPSRFTNPVLLRRLSIGWMRLENLQSLLSKATSLLSLSIKECWGVDMTWMAGQFRELVLENLDFSYMQCSFELPRIHSLKYSGQVFDFYFDIMNVIIPKVYLDFGEEREYDQPTQSTRISGEVISRILNDLRAASTLAVCPYILQTIRECKKPFYMLQPMETRHLVLRTKMSTKELNGIIILLKNCPNLETLSFEILPSRPFQRNSSYEGIDPKTFWMQNRTCESLRKTLKVVVVRDFGGSSNELNVLRYLIRLASGGGNALERVELYVPNGMEESQAMVVFAKAEMLQRTSKHVQVLCAQLLEN